MEIQSVHGSAMEPDFDLIVIGAGVIGLAIAHEAASSGFSVLIVEKAPSIGTETSSRNSEVIHAGIYYPQNSLKAQTCLEGKRKLYQFCELHGVPYRRSGKLIIASSDAQIKTLTKIQSGAHSCGVVDVSFLDKNEVSRIEPELECVAALSSPSTGIIDSHSYMQALLGVASAHEAEIVYKTQVTAITKNASNWSICIGGCSSPAATSKFIVNAAGLGAVDLAKNIDGIDGAVVPQLRYAKGSYFGYRGEVPFNQLIYPVPEAGGLGVHLTLDLAGQARFGPDVEWVDEIDYSVNPEHLGYFVDEVRKFWPEAEPERFYPDYSGIRPKLNHPDGSFSDFVISDEGGHKLPNLISLFGVESPGITASLAIAEMVVRRICKKN